MKEGSIPVTIAVPNSSRLMRIGRVLHVAIMVSYLRPK